MWIGIRIWISTLVPTGELFNSVFYTIRSFNIYPVPARKHFGIQRKTQSMLSKDLQSTEIFNVFLYI